MAEDDLDFQSFDNMDDLDWAKLEEVLRDKNLDETPGQAKTPALASEDMGGSQGLSGDMSGGINMQHLLEVPLDMLAEIGRGQFHVGETLDWKVGSVVEFEKKVGELVDVYINGKLVAQAEVVVVHEKFGLKIRDIIDPKERLESLRK